MFCPNCGTEILVEDSKFCFQCGAHLPDFNIYDRRDDCEETFEIEEAGSAEIEVESMGEDVRDIPMALEKNYEVIPLIGEMGNDVICPKPLFSQKRILHYRAYIMGTEYILPIGQYEVKFKTDCIVYSNLSSYIFSIASSAVSEFKQYYQNNVKNMEDWVGKAIPKAIVLVDWMQEKAEKLLIASKIYGYNAGALGSGIDMTCFSERMEAVIGRYAEVCENIEQTKLLRQLTNHSSSGRFVGGGFGFSGAMGGIMAAGVANAGAGIVRGVKNGITSIGDEMRNDAKKRAVFQNPENYNLLEEMIVHVSRALHNICWKIIQKETNHVHSVYNNGNKSKMLVTHALEYAQSEEEFWADIILALENCPYDSKVYEAVYTRYYKDILLISQLKEIYKLFLLDNLDDKIDELYDNEMEKVLQLPERTSAEVSLKMKTVKQQANAFGLDKREELQRLDALWSSLKEKEDEKEKYLNLLDKNIQIALAVEEAMEKRDFETIFKMIEAGSTIAEERYILYYITKIKNENHTELYNSIALNAGKHRAYLCIAGVCSYYGWGTEEDMEISIQCILKSAKLNCSYAKVFISAIYMQGLPQIADQQQAKEFLNEMVTLASPTMLYYYGRALSSGAKTGGSNFIKNNYKDAVLYLDYAVKCHIPGAEESLASVMSRGEERVNEETYAGSGGCYITTAACSQLGKADNCYELTVFREYRNKILAHEVDGEKIINEYYRTAPRIVDNINKQKNCEEIYQKIWNEFLSPCLIFLENMEYAKCKELYMQMVKELQRQYL